MQAANWIRTRIFGVDGENADLQASTQTVAFGPIELIVPIRKGRNRPNLTLSTRL